MSCEPQSGESVLFFFFFSPSGFQGVSAFSYHNPLKIENNYREIRGTCIDPAKVGGGLCRGQEAIAHQDKAAHNAPVERLALSYSLHFAMHQFKGSHHRISLIGMLISMTHPVHA